MVADVFGDDPPTEEELDLIDFEEEILVQGDELYDDISSP